MKARRIFTEADQRAFARLSGDWNPMHMDPVAARRLLPGRPVVHGIHLLLWAIDASIASRGATARLRSIFADFRKMVGVGEAAELEITGEDSVDRCRIRRGAALAATVELGWERGSDVDLPRPSDSAPAAREPSEVAREALVGMQGTTELCCEEAGLASLFPNLLRALDRCTCAELLATTRLIGMVCPGLHSIYNRLSLERVDAQLRMDAHQDFEVRHFDKRFDLLRIGVRGPTLQGTLEAFYRPQPSVQRSYEALGSLVERGEFSGCSALVVGGSRGLGEVAVKLLAAGGASVAFTYRKGAREAQVLEREVASSGGRVRSFEMDVLQPGSSLTAIRSELVSVSHLLYFATGPIFVAERGAFDPRVFAAFCDFYVTAFASIVEALLPAGLRRVLYPSSTAIDEIPADMGEYAAAKAAGESLCAFLAKTRPELVIRAPRFPRLATDQTKSLVRSREEAPERVLLPELRTLM